MLKRLILALALLIGAFVAMPASVEAAPLGATAQARSGAPATGVAETYYIVYGRPRRYGYRRYYRPRFYGYRRYYRPRYYSYRPRYYRRYYW